MKTIPFAGLLCLFGLLLASCRQSQSTQSNKPPRTIRFDTTEIGPDREASYTLEQGELKLLTNGEKFYGFKNDSLHKVTFQDTGRKKIPFRVVSLNKNVVLTSVKNEPDTYWCKVHRIAPDSTDPINGRRERLDAHLALVKAEDSVRYFLHYHYWSDDSKTRYTDYTIELDTLSHNYLIIED